MKKSGYVFIAGLIVYASLIPLSKAIDSKETFEEIPVVIHEEASPQPEPSPDPYIYCDEIPLSEEYQRVFQDACEEYGVPYNLALGVAEVESQFTFTAYSGWAYGIMQISPINYSWLLDEGIDATTNEGNIEAGVRMIGMFLDKYGDTHKALMAYNCGEAGAAELWEEGQTTSDYSAKVVAASLKWNDVISNQN